MFFAVTCTVTVGIAAAASAAGAAATRPVALSTAVAPAAAPHDAAQSATILIDPNAKSNGYTTPDVTIGQGGVLNVWNRDGIRHSVTSDDHDASGNALFSVIVNPNDPPTRIVEVSALAP